MKWLIVNTDYPAFLSSLYAANPGLEARPYVEQMHVRNDSLFGTADFYSANLRALGHEAWDVHANNEHLQRAWAGEHGRAVPDATPHRRLSSTRHRGTVLEPLRRAAPLVRPLRQWLRRRRTWLHDVLIAQARLLRPDVILNHDPLAFSAAFVKELRGPRAMMIAQVASRIPERFPFTGYDLLLSSFPHFVERYRARGVPAELLRLAFEPRVLERVSAGTPAIPLSFVGSVTPDHVGRIRLLERLCAVVDLPVWGPGMPAAGPAVRRSYRGEAWGRRMYEILGSSRMSLNSHIEVATEFANNMRLFEATGMGSLLLTDAKSNLHELFEPGREVVTFASADECLERIHHYLAHDDERAAIAAAGQRRTLREHTYPHRMRELVDIAGRHL